MRQHHAECERSKHQQHIGTSHLFDSHDDAKVVIGAGYPVEQQRMDKINEHGEGREGADSLIQQRLLCSALQPVQRQAEENNGADGVQQALRTELMIGIGQVQQAVALALDSVIAAVNIISNCANIKGCDSCAISAQQADKFIPIDSSKATAYKNKQIMQGQVVEAIIEEIFRQNAPASCIQAWMRCPPVKKQLKNAEKD